MTVRRRELDPVLLGMSGISKDCGSRQGRGSESQDMAAKLHRASGTRAAGCCLCRKAATRLVTRLSVLESSLNMPLTLLALEISALLSFRIHNNGKYNSGIGSCEFLQRGARITRSAKRPMPSLVIARAFSVTADERETMFLQVPLMIATLRACRVRIVAREMLPLKQFLKLGSHAAIGP